VGGTKRAFLRLPLRTAFRVEDGMPIDLHPGAARFYRSQMER
jgi:TRAP-type uncharacterized transport system substrate-binding protein